MTASNRRNDFTASYANSRTALKLIADYSRRWELRQHTYGYRSPRIKVPYRAETDLYVSLSLVVYPATSRSIHAVPPAIAFEEESGGCRFEIKDRRLTVTVPLDRPHLWGTVKGSSKPLLYVDRSWQNGSLCQWTPGVSLDLRVWITKGTEVWVPDEYESGDGTALSGGQFESNRRKH